MARALSCLDLARDPPGTVCEETRHTLAPNRVITPRLMSCLSHSEPAQDFEDEDTQPGAFGQRSRALLAEVNSIIDWKGPKEVAHELGTSVANLANNRFQRGAHKMPLQALPYLVSIAPNDNLVAMQASWRGKVIANPEPLTDGEKVSRFAAGVMRMPAEMAEAFLRGIGLTIEDLIGPRVAPRRAG